MDDKQKYKKALERARYYKERDNIQFLENIFPELKESEDEKIRKELIDIVKKSPITFAFDNKDKVLAWLDTQKETNLSSQEVKEAAEEFMLTQDTYNSRDEYQIIHAFIRGANWKEKQRCEWSEEDEKLLKLTLDNLKELENAYGESYGKVENCISWLKSFKPQPKQEWNKDTLQWIDSIIRDYQDLLEKDKDHKEVIKVKIEILKSLKPQPHWKPSEENIKDLEWCADLFKEKMGVGFHRLQVFIDEIKQL